MFKSEAIKAKEKYFLPNYVAMVTGYPIKRSGTYWITFCPFCQKDKKVTWRDRRFWVNDKTCNCLNPKCASVKPMDIINFYSRLYGVTNSEAIRYLNSTQ